MPSEWPGQSRALQGVQIPMTLCIERGPGEPPSPGGSLRFLPTTRAFREDGSEPRPSLFAGQAERDLTAGELTSLDVLPWL